MRITQWGEYGVHCSIFIAQQSRLGKKTVNAAEVCSSQGIDQLYAQQILQRLRKGDIIDSVRGPTGGYKLTRSAKDITLYDILVASEGETFEVICESKPLNHERCSDGAPCNLRPIWQQLREHVDSFLRRFTLEQLLTENAPELLVQISGREDQGTIAESAMAKT